jgi:4-amino-4-deoxy-L-arabinose transferase-like glycosyltransferase
MDDRKFDRFDALLAAACLVVFLAMLYLPFGAKPFGDLDIHMDAKTFASAIRGELPWSSVGLNRLPLSTVYYAVPYVFVHSGSPERTYWVAAITWTAVWTIVSLLLLRRAARHLGGEDAGIIAMVLVLVSPFVIYYALGITADAPSWILACVALFGWARWEQSHSVSALLLGSAGLAGVVLCRPNAVLVLGFGVLSGLVLWRLNRLQAIFAIAASSLALAISLAVSLLQSHLPHPPVRSGLENLAHVAFHGSFQFRDEPWDWRFWDDETRQGSVDYQHWVDTSAALKQTASSTGQPVSQLQLRWIAGDYARHPFTRLRIALVRILALHVSVTNSMQPAAFQLGPFRHRFGWLLFHGLVNAPTFLIVGAVLWFLALHRHDLASLWLLWAPWVSLMIFHALTYGEPRYLMPARPGLVVMAGCALAPLMEAVRKRRSTTQALKWKLPLLRMNILRP